VAPVLALIGLVTSAVLIVAYFPVLVGDDGWALSLGLIAAVPLFWAFGVGQAKYLKASKPAAYTRITDSIAG
jgi:hypothetical protein